MNAKLIAGLTLAAGAILLGLVQMKADEEFRSDEAMAQAIRSRAKDLTERYEAAKAAIAIRKNTLKREAEAMGKELASYKTVSGYESRRAAAYHDADAALETFRQSIGYEEALAKANREKSEAIEVFKRANDYDGKLSSLQALIDDAKAKFAAQEKLLDGMGGNLADTAKSLKRAAEDARDKVVSETEAQIHSLEQQLAAVESKADKAIQRLRTSLEEKLVREKARLSEKAAKELAAIDGALAKAKQDIEFNLTNARTDAERIAFQTYEDNCLIVETQDAADREMAAKIFASCTRSDRFAYWLRNHKIGKALVIFVATIPATANAYLFYRYVRFVMAVVKTL